VGKGVRDSNQALLIIFNEKSCSSTADAAAPWPSVFNLEPDNIRTITRVRGSPL
jgi:hypothetical protein